MRQLTSAWAQSSILAIAAVGVGLQGCIFIPADWVRSDATGSGLGSVEVFLVTEDGRPFLGARPTLAGLQPTEQFGGHFRFDDVPAGWAAAGGVSGVGVAPVLEGVEVPEDGLTVLTVGLARLEPTQPVVHDPALPYMKSFDGGAASIQFPADVLADQAPCDPCGLLDWVHPTEAGLAPAHVEADDGGPTPLALRGVVYLSLTDTDGAPLPADDEAPPLTLRARVTGDAIASETEFGAYWFDPAAGSWTRVAEAELDPTGNYLSGPVPRHQAGWWALGASSLDVGCTSGRVSDPTGPVPFAEVRVLEDESSTTWRVQAGEDGRFCAPIAVATPSTVSLRGVHLGALMHRDEPLPTGAAAPAECGSGCAGIDGSTQVAPDADDDGFFAGPGGDCNDNDADIRPGADQADQVGNGVDENCDAHGDWDGDGVDEDRDGVPSEASGGTDCAPEDPDVYPGAPARCDETMCGEPAGPAQFVDVGGPCVPCSADTIVDLGPTLYWQLEDIGPGTAWTADSSGWGRDGFVEGLDQVTDGISHFGGKAPSYPGVVGNHIVLDEFDGMSPAGFSLSVWWRTFVDRSLAVAMGVQEEPEPDDTGIACLARETSHTGAPCDPHCVDASPNQLKRPCPEAFTQFEDKPEGFQQVISLNPQGSDATGQVLTASSLGLSVQLDSEEGTRIYADTVGEWVHVVVSFDAIAGEQTVYVNNEEVGHHTFFPDVVPAVPEAGRLFLGADPDCFDAVGGSCTDTWQSWHGTIDEFAFFDRPLTPEEVNKLYSVTTCGDGLQCQFDSQGVPRDLDGDGRANEHLVGTHAGDSECPAASCAELIELEAFVSEGYHYWLEGPQGGSDVLAWCDAQGNQELCGDGRVAAAHGIEERRETCDGSAPLGFTCVECMIDAPGYETCHELFEAYQGRPWLVSGPYRLYPGGVATPRMCDMGDGPEGPVTGGGWTRVVNQDTRTRLSFAAPDMPPGRFAATFGVLGDPLTVGDVHHTAYSILGTLEDYRGSTGRFEFRAKWLIDQTADGFEEFDFAWIQDTNPADPVDGLASPNMKELYCGSVTLDSNPRFTGLWHKPAPKKEECFGGCTPLGCNCQWDSYIWGGEALADGAPAYSVGTILWGMQLNKKWLLPVADNGVFQEGTSRAVELWVRPSETAPPNCN